MTGRTISHYKVLAKVGQGAMGEVYKAEDLDLRRTVALKFLSRETLGEEDVKARLIREAQAAASLDHPNVCQVYGIHEDQGQTFIAMAYIDGPSLADKIKERPLPLQEALNIAVQIAEGLQEAHERGVVHRDIKPSNVMLDRRGRVKILDFGLAAVADRTRLTKRGTTLGTPAYMSPEQAQGRAVDRRTDIWALGVVLCEMLTAKHPFPGEYEQAVVYGIINEDSEPVTALRSGLPAHLDQIVAKALAKSSEERYQHADEMLVDVKRLQRESSEEQVSTRLKGAPPKSLQTAASESFAAQGVGFQSSHVQPKTARLRGYWWVVHHTAVVLLYGVMVVVLWQVKEENRGLSTLLLFFGLLACAIANGTLRIHLPFTAGFNRNAIEQEITRTAPWVRRFDWVFAVLLVGAAAVAVLFGGHLTAGVLAAVAVGYLVVFLVVEPATVRAVFRGRNHRETRSTS